jgi:hypothetical protein
MSSTQNWQRRRENSQRRINETAAANVVPPAAPARLFVTPPNQIQFYSRQCKLRTVLMADSLINQETTHMKVMFTV